MEIRGIQISGIPAVDVRNALREFIADDSCHTWKNGRYEYVPKRLSTNFLASSLQIDFARAEELLNSLISEDYVDVVKLVPTPKGMALWQGEDRDRLDLASAKGILEKFLAEVERENSRPDARVFVERVLVFGSFERGEKTVGDIDLIVEMPLPEDCLPEDMQEQEDLAERLKISDYLSFHDETDYVASAVSNRLLYERTRKETYPFAAGATALTGRGLSSNVRPTKEPMRELIEDLMRNPSQKRLVVMPLTRLLFYEPFAIDGFHFFPSEAIDLTSLSPVPNKALETAGEGADVIALEGQSLREVSTSVTGFDIEILANSPLVAFNVEIDWNEFLEANHEYDISLLKLLSSKAERALDVIRLFYCQLDLPNTLPGQIGSWEGSGEYLGALLYSPEDHESYLIAGAAVESSAIVRGLGLEIDANPHLALPSAHDGEVAGVVLHGLSLYSEALNSSNETIKFSRAMTLLEFLASPDEYQNWKKLKGDIACHCAGDKASYLRLCERFRALTSIDDASGKQVGLRTLIVHNGKLLPELLPSFKDRAALFRELQGYAFTVLTDMLSNAGASWAEYVEHRDQLKRALGVT